MTKRIDINSIFETVGFDVFTAEKSGVIKLVNEIVHDTYGQHCTSTVEEHRNGLKAAQDLLNDNKIHHKLVRENFDRAALYVGSEDISIQSVVYLRGVRPSKHVQSEYLDFHRENFYCDEDYINYQINWHVALSNYNKNSAMQYLPDSQKIKDEDIQFQKKTSSYSGVERFSTGHSIGLSYNPKIIQNLESLGTPTRLGMDDGDVFAFTSRLLHGGGSNNTDDVRFSLDFGLMASENLWDMKKKHFASYSSDFEHYTDLR